MRVSGVFPAPRWNVERGRGTWDVSRKHNQDRTAKNTNLNGTRRKYVVASVAYQDEWRSPGYYDSRFTVRRLFPPLSLSSLSNPSDRNRSTLSSYRATARTGSRDGHTRSTEKEKGKGEREHPPRGTKPRYCQKKKRKEKGQHEGRLNFFLFFRLALQASIPRGTVHARLRRPEIGTRDTIYI